MIKKKNRRDLAHELWTRAEKLSESGDHKAAFRLMLKAAKLGELGAQTNVGYMYDTGSGVRHNQASALKWYKRAYRRGEVCAANNIGTIWRDEKNFKKALYWFRRVIALRKGDDGDAELEIGKLYLRNNNIRLATYHLKRVLKSRNVTEAGQEEAEKCLSQISRSTTKARPKSRPN